MKTKTRKTPRLRTIQDTPTAKIALDGDPQVVAKSLVALIPLDDVCGDKALMDAFLSEMFLAIARASSRKERRRRQAEGIAAAKARGVQFGKKTPPLPDNFDQMRRAWRNGEYNLIDAARLCGMAKSTFYSAVLRAEDAGAQNAVPSEEGGDYSVGEDKRTLRQEWTADPLLPSPGTALPHAGSV